MNKASERYNKKVEIPISVILETIFSSDNRDVETLCRWAKHYGYVDLIKKDENDKLGYYKLQDDYTKQSFYTFLSKEERKQYDYEDYLIEQADKYKSILDKIKEKGVMYYDPKYSKIYGELCSIPGANNTRTPVIVVDNDILELLEEIDAN